jgi:hypothetical protein
VSFEESIINAKSCKICGDRFIPLKTFTNTCSDGCKAIQAIRDNEKVKKKSHGKALKAFNDSDTSILKRKAQESFNAYIRTRDGKHCISCEFEPYYDEKNKLHTRQFHAGHYKSQGGNSALRFDELNCHAQCSICNNHLSGNLANYRIKLIEKIGIEAVENLEQTKATKRWMVEELKEIIETYKKKIKGL